VPTVTIAFNCNTALHSLDNKVYGITRHSHLRDNSIAPSDNIEENVDFKPTTEGVGGCSELPIRRFGHGSQSGEVHAFDRRRLNVRVLTILQQAVSEAAGAEIVQCGRVN